ncbi:MAG: hypothetical protein KDK70_42670, partial [Myxococcales bacterium]|nr:hypothetical protein [Myxococcales bacterium]
MDRLALGVRTVLVGLGVLLGGCVDPGATPGETEGSSGTSGSGPSTAMACIPGASVSCTCSDGSMGAQICNAEGTALGPCECTQTDSTASSTTSTTATATSTTTDSTSSSTTDDPDTSTGSSEGSSSSGEPDTSCNAIDFLFVVDDSGSTADEQSSLIAAFPAFVSGIESTLGQVDSLHVGVVTTDAYFPNAAGCSVLGGLVVETGGPSSSNAICGPYVEGFNFMTEQDDLASTFSCAAQVGTGGSGVERPMDAMRAAIGPGLGMPGACNEQFLRPEALLVIVIVTDEWDGPNDPEVPGSAGTPADWYADVVAAKGGVAEHVVVLSMINYVGGPCPPSDVFYDGVHIAD